MSLSDRPARALLILFFNPLSIDRKIIINVSYYCYTMTHHRIKNTKDITGFSLTAAREGEKVKVAIKGFITSNERVFFKFIQGIYNVFIKPFIQLEKLNQFLILRHKDKSADIYINDFQLVTTIYPKKEIKAGQLVKKKDIVDIKTLEFPNIIISKTDAIIFCMRVGWKFVIYFNFTANPDFTKKIELDLSQVYHELGYVYRFLLFEEEYELIKNNKIYPKMLSDGWFPFIELIGADYQELSNLYSNQWLDQIDGFLKRFNKSRIDNMTKSWWTQKLFQDKQKIIEAGISAFLQGNNSGYINCINTIYPQIEGIMGFDFFKEHGKKPTFNELKEYIKNKAQNRFSSKDSLGFHEYFYEYLDKDIFQKFDLSTGKIDLARHSLAHGYAKQEDFTKAKALQALLILNQLFFYL